MKEISEKLWWESCDLDGGSPPKDLAPKWFSDIQKKKRKKPVGCESEDFLPLCRNMEGCTRSNKDPTTPECQQPNGKTFGGSRWGKLRLLSLLSELEEKHTWQPNVCIAVIGNHSELWSLVEPPQWTWMKTIEVRIKIFRIKCRVLPKYCLISSLVCLMLQMLHGLFLSCSLY